MKAVTVDAAVKVAIEPKAKAGERLDLGMAVYLSAGRFASPAGMVFLTQCYIPSIIKKKH